jgi:hypothetical protein
MISPHTLHRKGREKTNGGRCKWMEMTPRLSETKHLASFLWERGKSKRGGALWGKGTTHYMHGSVSTNEWTREGALQVGSRLGKDTKNVPSSLGYHVLIPQTGPYWCDSKCWKVTISKEWCKWCTRACQSIHQICPRLPQIRQVGGYSSDTIQLIMLPNISLQQSFQWRRHAHTHIATYSIWKS